MGMMGILTTGEKPQIAFAKAVIDRSGECGKAVPLVLEPAFVAAAVGGSLEMESVLAVVVADIGVKGPANIVCSVVDGTAAEVATNMAAGIAQKAKVLGRRLLGLDYSIVAWRTVCASARQVAADMSAASAADIRFQAAVTVPARFVDCRRAPAHSHSHNCLSDCHNDDIRAHSRPGRAF